MSDTPLLLITPGDFAGVGPEVALKAVATNQFKCKIKLIGPKFFWKQTANLFSLPLNIEIIDVPDLSDVSEKKLFSVKKILSSAT